jgi:hypothetical protein
MRATNKKETLISLPPFFFFLSKRFFTSISVTCRHSRLVSLYRRCSQQLNRAKKKELNPNLNTSLTSFIAFVFCIHLLIRTVRCFLSFLNGERIIHAFALTICTNQNTFFFSLEVSFFIPISRLTCGRICILYGSVGRSSLE